MEQIGNIAVPRFSVLVTIASSEMTGCSSQYRLSFADHDRLQMRFWAFILSWRSREEQNGAG